MTSTELAKLLEDKSQEWRDGFFSAVNLTSEMKAAFLGGMIGEQVTVTEERK